MCRVNGTKRFTIDKSSDGLQGRLIQSRGVSPRNYKIFKRYELEYNTVFGKCHLTECGEDPSDKGGQHFSIIELILGDGVNVLHERSKCSLGNVIRAMLLCDVIWYRVRGRTKGVITNEGAVKLPVSQILAMFIKTARKFAKLYREFHLERIEKAEGAAKKAEKTLIVSRTVSASPSQEFAGIEVSKEPSLKRDIQNVAQWEATAQNLNDDLDEAGRAVREKLREKQRELINTLDLQQYAIAGDEDEWNAEIKKKGQNLSGAVLNIGPSSKGQGSAEKKSLAKSLYDRRDADLIKKAKKSKYAK